MSKTKDSSVALCVNAYWSFWCRAMLKNCVNKMRLETLVAHVMEKMWERGQRDFTWICTRRLFDDSGCNNMTIDEFRAILEIDRVRQRQARTKNKK